MSLLSEKLSSRELTQHVKWGDFATTLKDDSRYANMVGQPGSTPRELFEDALFEEKEILKAHKKPFKSFIKVSVS